MNLPLSPCVDQKPEEMEAYYRNATIGSPAVIRSTEGGQLRYAVCTIQDRKERLGRVYLEGSMFKVFYMKSGRLCPYRTIPSWPVNKTSLVLPTEAVLAWAAAHPNGKFGVSTLHPDVHRR